MSKPILYCPPAGDDLENPSLDYLREVVFSKGAEYWRQGSGDSAIEFTGMNERLVFFYDEPHGFFLMMHPDYEVPYRAGKEIVTHEHTVGGNTFKVPSNCYFSREDAWTIIEHFIKSGTKSQLFQWINLYDIEFEHGF